jgi:hypothetical protein
MQSNLGKLAILGAAAAALVVLFIVLSGGDDSSDDSTTSTSSAPGQIPTIEIKDGKPLGGIQQLEFTSGDQIRFKVTSDADWEIHFHGYDVMMDVTPDKPVTFDVPADIEGIFEVEIEDTATQIAEITVNPG